jgi:hypothetical protein
MTETLTGDRYTDKWLLDNAAGQLCLSLCQGARDRKQAGKALVDEDTLVENIYARLPSGDYGRGDVRRVLRAALAGRLE